MPEDLCGIIKGKLKPKHFKTSTSSSNRHHHEEVLSLCADDDVALNQDEDPSLEEGLYAIKPSSPPTAEEAPVDVEADHTSLTSPSHRRLPNRRSKDSDVESFG